MIEERISPGTLMWDLYYLEHRQRYEFFAPRCKGRRVLDAACGVGYGASILVEGGATSILAADISEQAIGYAKNHYGDPAVKFVTGDCESLESLGAKFDVLVSFETVEHLRRPERLVEGAYNVLEQNGIFICSTPNIFRHSLAPHERSVNPHHVSEMSFPEFEALVGKHFIVEERYYQSESPSYMRYLDSLRELYRMSMVLQSSLFMRLEQLIRKVLGRQPMLLGCAASAHGIRYLERPVPGDYVIEPLKTREDWQKTYILLAKRR